MWIWGLEIGVMDSFSDECVDNFLFSGLKEKL
jgi:hypothetical protein